MAVQGFGNVGSAAVILAPRRLTIAVGDHTGYLFNPEGFKPTSCRTRTAARSIEGAPQRQADLARGFFSMKADIFAPSALENQIKEVGPAPSVQRHHRGRQRADQPARREDPARPRRRNPPDVAFRACHRELRGGSRTSARRAGRRRSGHRLGERWPRLSRSQRLLAYERSISGSPPTRWRSRASRPSTRSARSSREERGSRDPPSRRVGLGGGVAPPLARDRFRGIGRSHVRHHPAGAMVLRRAR